MCKFENYEKFRHFKNVFNNFFKIKVIQIICQKTQIIGKIYNF